MGPSETINGRALETIEQDALTQVLLMIGERYRQPINWLFGAKATLQMPGANVTNANEMHLQLLRVSGDQRDALIKHLQTLLDRHLPEQKGEVIPPMHTRMERTHVYDHL